LKALNGVGSYRSFALQGGGSSSSASVNYHCSEWSDAQWDAAICPQWQPSWQYSQGTVVIYQSDKYTCTVSYSSSSTSAPPASDSQHWQVGGNCCPSWATGVTYEKGTVVTYQGASYTCIATHTSSAQETPPQQQQLWTPGGKCAPRSCPPPPPPGYHHHRGEHTFHRNQVKHIEYDAEQHQLP